MEIDRDLKKQLQLRKELNHDNVARFIGACVETPHVYILTQFCQRGSLQVSFCVGDLGEIYVTGFGLENKLEVSQWL